MGDEMSKNKSINSIKLDRNIKITENLEEVLKTAVEQKNNLKKGYWSNHDRLIDPVIIAVFYGLYKSRKLPSFASTIDAPINHEFNVDITAYTKVFNHFLFCLWLKNNKMPVDEKNYSEYRVKLYDFVEKILDEDIWRTTIIPFYVLQADYANEPALSFLYKLRNTHSVDIESLSHSPEFLAMEFIQEQQEFLEEVVENIHQSIFEPE